jgi:hypothetical protein
MRWENSGKICLTEVEHENWIGFFWLGIWYCAAAVSYEHNDELLLVNFLTGHAILSFSRMTAP